MSKIDVKVGQSVCLPDSWAGVTQPSRGAGGRRPGDAANWVGHWLRSFAPAFTVPAQAQLRVFGPQPPRPPQNLVCTINGPCTINCGLIVPMLAPTIRCGRLRPDRLATAFNPFPEAVLRPGAGNLRLQRKVSSLAASLCLHLGQDEAPCSPRRPFKLQRRTLEYIIK